MGLLFCYTVFGRRGKVGKAVPDSQCKTRKAELESSDSARRDVALLKDMEGCKVVRETLKKDEALKDTPDYVIEGALSTSYVKEQPDSDRGGVTHEFVVDMEKLSSYETSLQIPYIDHSKSYPEAPVRSSCSQGNFQVEVSLSMGEGVASSDGHRAVLTSAFDDVHEYASFVSSYGECSNLSSRAQGFHDGNSAGCVGPPLEFAIGNCHLDNGSSEVVTDSKSEDAAEGGKSLDSSGFLDAHVCDDEERYLGHVYDPGWHAREALKMSPAAGGCLDESLSPKLGAIEIIDTEKYTAQAGNETAQPPCMSEDIPSGGLKTPLSRVKDWVNSIESLEPDFGLEDDDRGCGTSLLESPYVGSSEAIAALCPLETSSASSSLMNTAVRSLHPSSTVAHLSGIGLHEVPLLGIFSSLRSLNLSANLIVHVPVGCLPRSLHSLDLSRNRIAQIEGFRELTRLRVLNLSNNRITRIGGVANCTLIKELYLAGNKIADIEGLHRLLKLAVLDVSFNKITTSKALDQLAANYGSLLALNLLGNPILTNFNEDQIRKLVTALVPHVAYLNRQPLKAISAREAALDSVARAALGAPQHHSKWRDVNTGRKTVGAAISSVKKRPPPHQHSRHSGKVVASAMPNL